MIVAIYARVSTTDQSCGMQLHDLRQYVARHGWEVFAEYVDTGFSGASASRPELDRLLQDAQLGRFEALLDCADGDLFDWICGGSTRPFNTTMT